MIMFGDRGGLGSRVNDLSLPIAGPAFRVLCKFRRFAVEKQRGKHIYLQSFS
jgi:hypothetical protein